MTTVSWFRTVLIIHATAAFGAGILFLMQPTAVSEQYQLLFSQAARLLVQAVGAVQLLIGLLLLLAWYAAQDQARLAFALALGNGAAFLIALIQQIAIWEASAGWLTVGFFLLFAGAYAPLASTAAPDKKWWEWSRPIVIGAALIAIAGLVIAFWPTLIPFAGFPQGRTGFELHAISRLWGIVLFNLGLLVWAAANGLRRFAVWLQSLPGSLGFGLFLLLVIGFSTPGLTAVWLQELTASPVLSLVGAVATALGAALLLALYLWTTLNPIRLLLEKMAAGDLVEAKPIMAGWPLTALARPVNFLASQIGEMGTMRGRLRRQIREAAAQEERNRLARDLHDSVKQQIFSVSVSAAAVAARWEKDREGAQAALADVRQSAQAAMVEMNAMLQQLRPTPLENIGLTAALREQCEALSYRIGADVAVSFGEMPDDDWLPPGAQTDLFRIAQEALANVARHARASHVRLQLAVLPEGVVQLTVTDDGQGFDPQTTTFGMGLGNIRERAAALGGDVTIASQPGAGATIQATLPLRLASAAPPAAPDAGEFFINYAERQLRLGLWVSLGASLFILLFLSLQFSFFPSFVVALAMFSLGLWANSPFAAHALNQIPDGVLSSSETKAAVAPAVIGLRQKIQDRRTVTALGLLLIILTGNIPFAPWGLAYLLLLFFGGFLVLLMLWGSYQVRRRLLAALDKQARLLLRQKMERERRAGWFVVGILGLIGVGYLIYMTAATWPFLGFFPPDRPVDWWLQSVFILAVVAFLWRLALGRLLREV